MSSCDPDIRVIAAFMNTFLYGLYVSTLAHCIRWLLFRYEGWKLRKQINIPLLVITIYSSIVLTVNAGMVLQKAIYPSWGCDIPAYIVPIVVITTLGFTLFWIVDAVLIYQCWVLYAKSWRVICPPLALWTMHIISSIIGVTWSVVGTANMDQRPLSTTWILKSFDIFFAFTTAATVYATFAIVYHSARSLRSSDNNMGYCLNGCCVTAESGLLLSITLLSTSIAMAAGTNLQLGADIFVNINLNAIGISFNLVLIRVGHKQAKAENNTRPHENVAMTTLRFANTSGSSALYASEEKEELEVVQ
ncbi:hypothetical protein M378DRAFT_904536 [Amanita muscaria Koide BX008]|uniref:Uncharacterized protein n=1 Tax=Amanita muscaria (strain Koide BX008) TaxID=946122 RepID=A0A0C2T2V7_AMAMK|nr:hypothetical protein M378DRAFT_904536 [Amanita muscaria Koide BX008]